LQVGKNFDASQKWKGSTLALALWSLILPCKAHTCFKPLQRRHQVFFPAIAAPSLSQILLHPLPSFYPFSTSHAPSFSFSPPKLGYCFRQSTEPPQSWTSSSPVFLTICRTSSRIHSLDQSLPPILAPPWNQRLYSSPHLVLRRQPAYRLDHLPLPTDIRKRRTLTHFSCPSPLLSPTPDGRYYIFTPHPCLNTRTRPCASHSSQEELITSGFGLDPGWRGK
jgi:hypothetical protein